MATPQTALNSGQPTLVPDAMQATSMGDILAGLVPRRLVRTVASSATQIEPEPGALLIVSIADDAALLMIEAGTAGAGEALVTYDADGVATIVFGDGAQTAYRVVKQVLPAGHAASLAGDLGQAL